MLDGGCPFFKVFYFKKYTRRRYQVLVLVYAPQVLNKGGEPFSATRVRNRESTFLKKKLLGCLIERVYF